MLRVAVSALIIRNLRVDATSVSRPKPRTRHAGGSHVRPLTRGIRKVSLTNSGVGRSDLPCEPLVSE
jgi:hypothetical protein